MIPRSFTFNFVLNLSIIPRWKTWVQYISEMRVSRTHKRFCYCLIATSDLIHGIPGELEVPLSALMCAQIPMAGSRIISDNPSLNDTSLAPLPISLQPLTCLSIPSHKPLMPPHTTLAPPQIRHVTPSTSRPTLETPRDALPYTTRRQLALFAPFLSLLFTNSQYSQCNLRPLPAYGEKKRRAR